MFSLRCWHNITDIALDLIQKCPHLVLALDELGLSPLYALADMPNAFRSGDGLVFWKRWIYNYCESNLFFSYCFSLNFFLVLCTGLARLDIISINIIYNIIHYGLLPSTKCITSSNMDCHSQLFTSSSFPFFFPT
jgi:hypothetical protein